MKPLPPSYDFLYSNVHDDEIVFVNLSWSIREEWEGKSKGSPMRVKSSLGTVSSETSPNCQAAGLSFSWISRTRVRNPNQFETLYADIERRSFRWWVRMRNPWTRTKYQMFVTGYTSLSKMFHFLFELTCFILYHLNTNFSCY